MSRALPRSADTIVVGAGSAGLVIAARATESTRCEVLVIEAGPDYPDMLPPDLRDGTRNSMTDHDWGYHAVPTRGQVPFAYPRGRVVGGSSAVNTCIALRGQPDDYDEWDLPEWTWEKCLPFFRKLERDLDFTDPWHGQDGPIPIRRHRTDELSPWQAAFVEACREVGFDECADANDPRGTGAGPHAMNKVNGERVGVSTAYLTPAVRSRANLSIAADCLTRRVVFRDGRVTGVEVDHRGNTEVIAARRVLLCAGAIGTLGILLRSGVGPRDELARLGVAPVADAPAVGARLLDHPGSAMFLLPRRGVARTSDPLLQTLVRYRSRQSTMANDMTLQPGSFVPMPVADFELVSVMCMIGKPRGHGTIRFESAAPDARPHIENRFLEDPDELEMACEAMELAWLIATTAPMADLARPIAPAERAFASRRELRRWLPFHTGSGYHPCGTVPMGLATDEQGRVRGVDGLIVADASLFPTIPSANLNLSVIMLGERFGDWLARGDIE